jgi:hypothetical protein
MSLRSNPCPLSTRQEREITVHPRHNVLHHKNAEKNASTIWTPAYYYQEFDALSAPGRSGELSLLGAVFVMIS